ncbi:MAG: class I SAM-dependent methyltransferase [Planctomycetota bacterium]
MTTSYDAIPYRSYPFPQSSVERLAVTRRLFAAAPGEVDLGRCRVLEIGCAGGGNLLPIADRYPGATLCGVDLSTVHIDTAEATRDALGLGDVELVAADVAAWEPGGTFDFIVCHGVFSWVPPEVQDAILKRVKDSLAPEGVAYISYNTYPGWHTREILRDIMNYRARGLDDPEEQLEKARRTVSFLVNAMGPDENPYAALLRREFEHIDRAESYYLIHEHLEEYNRPCYFSDFVSRAEGHGLSYLAEAAFGSSSLAEVPPPVRDTLLAVAKDRVEVEQYLDFIRNRGFRQTLLVHADSGVREEPGLASLTRLHLASSAVVDGEAETGEGETLFRRGGSTLRTRDPVIRHAFRLLREAWPRRVPFTELYSASVATVRGRPVAVSVDGMNPDVERFCRPLLRCFETGMVDLHVGPAPFATELSERPRVSRLARLQSLEGATVTSGHHANATLDDIERRVLQMCDGETPAADFAGRLAGDVAAGSLVMFGADGRRLSDAVEIDKALQPLVPKAIRKLLELGLFR